MVLDPCCDLGLPLTDGRCAGENSDNAMAGYQNADGVLCVRSAFAVVLLCSFVHDTYMMMYAGGNMDSGDGPIGPVDDPVGPNDDGGKAPTAPAHVDPPVREMMSWDPKTNH